MTVSRPFLLLGCVAAIASSVACSSSSAPESKFASTAPPLKAVRLPDGSLDDRSMCDWRGRKDRDVVETAGPGAIFPNIRRVFAIVGQGNDRQRILVCREVDTNLDGIKDVVRKYNDKGEATFEEADTNYDGRIDTWLTFSKGHLSEAKYDRDYDGNPDEWDYYVGGRISRIERDTRHAGKPDRWEIYGPEGKLERVGVDVDGDERVDRWDYDTEIRKARDEEERKAEEAAADKAAKDNAQGEYAAADPNAPPPDAKGDKNKKPPQKTPPPKTPPPPAKKPAADAGPAGGGAPPPAH